MQFGDGVKRPMYGGNIQHINMLETHLDTYWICARTHTCTHIKLKP